MVGFDAVLFLRLQAITLTIFLNRHAIMASAARTTDQLWADGPCALIATPQYVTKRTDMFTLGATHMAHIHNAILRGYNSIYLQAPHITDEDKPEFIGYAQAWFRFVKSHHDDEELELFSKVEEVVGTKGIWDKTHKEHESFLTGLANFNDYLAQLAEPYDFDGQELRRIMKSFQGPFVDHFHNEIATIASFAELPTTPKPGSQKADEGAAVFKAWGKKTVTKAGYADVVPFFLMNLDVTYEDGMWANWPPMPALIRWGMVNIAGAYHWGWWKFASCDSTGKPRKLYALDFPENVKGKKSGHEEL